MGNLFQQEDLTGVYSDYNFVGARGEQQVGLYTDRLDHAHTNTFRTLATGIEANFENDAQVEIQGNLFLDCERGLRLSTRYSTAGSANPVLWTSCNTFERDANRPGQAWGMVVEPGVQPGPPLIFDSFPNSGAILKDLFDDKGYGASGDFFAIENSTNNVIVYNAFTTYFGTYQNWSTPVLVDFFDSGFLVNAGAMPTDPNLPCRLEPQAFVNGIQNRGTRTAAPSPGKPAAALDQNVPNPCTGSTTVAYRLPAGTRHAALLLRRGLDGTLVQECSLRPAASQHTLSLTGFAPGLYFYTLVADGVPVQTKRLLVE